MDEPIEDVYFNWLYSKVASVEVPTPSLTFYTLFRDLHSTEFVWMIDGDDNRAQDGKDLRREFLNSYSSNEVDLWLNMDCSVLEMLIAFARKAEFQTGMSTREWFWIFLENLGLHEFSDAKRGFSQRVADILDRFVWRTYRRDGHGGLFPLNHTRNDQRDIEIWYQFCEYLLEYEETHQL